MKIFGIKTCILLGMSEGKRGKGYIPDDPAPSRSNPSRSRDPNYSPKTTSPNYNRNYRPGYTTNGNQVSDETCQK